MHGCIIQPEAYPWMMSNRTVRSVVSTIIVIIKNYSDSIIIRCSPLPGGTDQESIYILFLLHVKQDFPSFYLLFLLLMKC